MRRCGLLLTAACLLSGCMGDYHFHYHAPAQDAPAMTLEIPLEQPDDQVD